MESYNSPPQKKCKIVVLFKALKRHFFLPSYNWLQLSHMNATSFLCRLIIWVSMVLLFCHCLNLNLGYLIQCVYCHQILWSISMIANIKYVSIHIFTVTLMTSWANDIRVINLHESTVPFSGSIFTSPTKIWCLCLSGLFVELHSSLTIEILTSSSPSSQTETSDYGPWASQLL